MHYYTDVLKKYAVFKGRAPRKEYWMFCLGNFIIGISINLVQFLLVLSYLGQLSSLVILIAWVFALGVIIPGIAVTVRRLHDTGRSGWWIFIGFVPIIGACTLFVFLVLDSQAGDNQYGSNPKGVTVATKGVNPFVILVIVFEALILIPFLFLSIWGFIQILKNNAFDKTNLESKSDLINRSAKQPQLDTQNADEITVEGEYSFDESTSLTRFNCLQYGCEIGGFVFNENTNEERVLVQQLHTPKVGIQRDNSSGHAVVVIKDISTPNQPDVSKRATLVKIISREQN
jgi:uncharacterized membrane protein YhaH (DUF805 family)